LIGPGFPNTIEGMNSSVSAKHSPRSTLVALLAVFYLVVRFGLTQWLDSFGAYATYVSELLVVTLASGLLWPQLKALFRLPKAAFVWGPIGILSGFLVFKWSGWINLVVPFDLSNRELQFFLLIVAPTLEELIFRFFCWQPVARLNRGLAFVTTSVLFSYSHLHSYWFVPVEYHGFVFFQSAYTLYLGLACGFMVWKHNSLLGAILIHFAFNLGFFLGSAGTP
jgi:membrane protease YdiL (CAAX protease family)